MTKKLAEHVVNLKNLGFDDFKENLVLKRLILEMDFNSLGLGSCCDKVVSVASCKS